MRKILFLSIFVLFLSSILSAKTDKIKSMRPVQVSFIYPLGSNGLSSMSYSNGLSLNVLFGLNGGVHGIEIGSLLNMNTGKVQGLQIAGLSNVNVYKTNGLMLAGVANVGGDSILGMQLSGVINIARKQINGLQASVINIASEDLLGIQTGVANYSKDVLGMQLGVVNIASNTMCGMQIGIVNQSTESTGLQLGLVNLSVGNSNVLPIGLVSIVKNGYYALEVSGGDALYANLTYKMGVDKFYTIYKASYSSYNSKPVYSFGLGFGTSIDLSKKENLNVDFSASRLVYDNEWNNTLNQLYKMDLNYKYNFTDSFSMFVGPSLNIYLTDEKVDGKFGTLEIPYSVYTKEWSNRKLSSWIGLNAGISVRF